MSVYFEHDIFGHCLPTEISLWRLVLVSPAYSERVFTERLFSDRHERDGFSTEGKSYPEVDFRLPCLFLIT